MPITKKELMKLPICSECKERSNEIYYVQWENKKYTCFGCIELAYHLLKAQMLSGRSIRFEE